MSFPIGPEGGAKYAVDQCLVACKGDDGTYYLASRRVFEGREKAAEYAATLAPEREPIIITAIKPITWHLMS